MAPPHLSIKNLLWVFGFATLLGIAFLSLTGPDAQQPKCDGQVMSPGDTCIVFDSNGSIPTPMRIGLRKPNPPPSLAFWRGLGRCCCLASASG